MNFPLFIDLKEKKVLIVGAGAIAARRATVLVEFGATVIVVAPEAGSRVQTRQGARTDKSAEGEKSPWECRTIPVRELAESGRLLWKKHTFGEQDLEELNQSFLVIAATDDPAVNDHIAQLCHERHIPVNHAGDQNQCDFQFPAIVRNDPVVIGVNAGGKDHGLVKRVAAGLREWIAGVL